MPWQHPGPEIVDSDDDDEVQPVEETPGSDQQAPAVARPPSLLKLWNLNDVEEASNLPATPRSTLLHISLDPLFCGRLSR